ncbi:MAG: purine-nucleoside phosphorylase [Bacteroidia bacterium]
MSLHIGAEPGSIAETVLLAGDPLRARFVAEQYLENAECYNQVRSMFGYTGYYKGQRISVQGTGMGLPSMAIYAQELMDQYGAKRLIRIGSCGAIQDHIELNDIIFAQGASTDSAFNRLRFDGDSFAPLASFSLLQKATQIADSQGFDYHVGNVLSSDFFYNEPQDAWKKWQTYGLLGLEMESVALYTLAAKRGVEALSILSVSDHLITGKALSSEAREKGFGTMLKLGLELGIK